MTTKARLACAVLAGLWVCAGAGRAFGSESFPEDMRRKLELPAIAGPEPGCRICHQDDEGGVMTANKPFARSLMLVGAAGANVPSFLAALDTLKANGTDSDGDGVSDIAELEAGTDPNVGTDGSQPFDRVPLPQTGCSVGRAPAALAPSMWLVVCLTLLAFGRHRCSPR